MEGVHEIEDRGPGGVCCPGRDRLFDAAQAEVTLRDVGNAKAKTITYQLARLRGGWRIHDIGTREVPSLRRLLINSSPKA